MKQQKAKYLPPNLALRWLQWFCHPQLLEDIQGDLEEEYEIRSANWTRLRTNSWLVLQVIGLMRPSLMRPFFSFLKLNNKIDMIKNHILIGFRNLVKYKVSTGINLLGLSTGMAAFVLIALFVKDELSYDKHHEHADNVFRVTVQNFNGDGETLQRQWAFASAGHASRLKADFPQVTHAARFFPWAFPDIVIGEKRYPGEQVVFADPDVFDIFTFPFLAGSKENAFKEQNSIVISEAAAIKLYGNDWRDQDIIGKNLKIEARGNGMSLTVTGVMEDMPRQQHFHFDYLSPFAIYENVVNNPDVFNNVGGNYNYLTYVRLANPSDSKIIEQGGGTFFDKYVGKIRDVPAHDYYGFVLQPLKDIHLTSQLSGEIENNGSLSQVIVFSVIGVLLILVACINYMNLATSRYTRRMKEVGVRKSIGATKQSLVGQFVTESALITLISFPIAIGLAALALPYVNTFMDKELSINFLRDYQLFGGMVMLLVLVTLVAGLYPAIYLSSLNTISSLKGEATFGASKVNFRSVLVTFQYVVTIGIIFSLAVVNAQMGFIFNSDPGYDKENVLQVSLSRDIYPKIQSFKNELLSNPNIKSASFQSRIPTGSLLDNMGATIFHGDSVTPVNFRLPYIGVDEDFIKTFDIQMAAGQDFTKDMDSDSVGYYLINEAAARELGFNSNEEAVGRKLTYGGIEGRIVGVTKDFHFESVHSPIGPMILLKNNNFHRSICLKIAGGNMQEVVAFVEETWDRFDTKNPINYSFVDESFEQQYQAEERLSSMFKVFAVVAVLISCLGMLGMVTFIVERKTKEIGIRKVLGARSGNIMWLVSRSFLVLIGIACAVALPLGYYLMSNWLQQFAYQINISIGLMVIPIAAVLVITMATILYRIVKAVYINPVKYLRSE